VALTRKKGPAAIGVLPFLKMGEKCAAKGARALCILRRGGRGE